MANQGVTTPATEAVNAKLIDPGVKKYWFDEFSEHKPKLDLVFKVSSMTGAYEEHTTYAGHGEVPEVGEQENYSEDAILHVQNTTVTAKKYGVKIPVSYELWEDQREKIAGRVQTQARAAARTIEGKGAGVYINAFNTSYTSYGDGLPLCSTGHTSADGGSNMSNASTTGITFTEGNLETGILAMRGQVDDRGNLKNVVPSKLLVPPALEKEALIVTKSDKRSETADNDKNVNAMTEYTGGKLDVVVWDYLGSAAGGSDTAWYLLDGKQHEVSWKWRIKPQVTKLPLAVGADNDTWYWKTRYRCETAWFNFRGVWGSKGDGASYTS